MASLESQVRERADVESATDRFPQTEVMLYISQSWAELYNHIIKHDQNDYMSKYTITTTAGVSDYALPSDMYIDKGVDTLVAGQTVIFDRWMWEERAKYDGFVTWAPGYPWAYSLVGDNISFRPAPSGVFTCNVWYYPAPSVLTSASNPIDCKAGFEEFMVADAAAKILVKDDRDASVCLGQKQAALQIVDMMASNRSRSNPNRVIRRWRRRDTRILRPV